MFADLYQETTYRLQNAIGKRRHIYNGMPNRAVTPKDVKNFEDLAAETKEQVELRQAAYTHLAQAAVGQVASDNLYLEIQRLLTQTRNQGKMLRADQRVFLSGQKLELSAKRLEVRALLAQNAERSRQIKAEFARRLVPAAAPTIEAKKEEPDGPYN